jgi:membrane protein required for colicin V production
MTILIIAVAIIGALVGFYQGALKQVANMAGIFVGLVIAVMLYEKFGKALANLTGTEQYTAEIIAFIAIVILLPLVLGWVASLLTKAFKVVHLNFINRLAGAVIGFVSYLFILSVAFNVYDFIQSNGGMKPEKLKERPALYYMLKQKSQKIVPDIIIVTDSTEEARGAKPHHAIGDKLHI